ncbi:LOW QUALITY PROTEIN: E3 ubiquitin-protein ligase CBLL2-like [Rhinolophus sinicus]|uniref:LOW QUALITY PROTEIN: E3 ubiquitin-protein ligase CBLL2-like n=1 Tax=Rhinolophus sinicus TaxID=89399 RepID=UPI003D7BE649
MNGMPAGEEEFEDNEERQYDCKRGELLRKKEKKPRMPLGNFKIKIIGEKDDSPVNFCDKCDLPVKIYGRMSLCKHAFCYEGANLYEKENGDHMYPGCSTPVLQTEERTRGSVFMCSTVQGGKRTYLSQRNLHAYINHYYKKLSPLSSPVVHQETISIPTKEHSKLMIILLDDSNFGAKQPSLPSHHHLEYQSQPVALYPYRVTPPEYHAPPPSLAPSVNCPMSYSLQGSGTPHMVCSQVPPLPMTCDPLPITSSPGYSIGQMPPYINLPSSGSPLSQNGGPPESESPLSNQSSLP